MSNELTNQLTIARQEIVGPSFLSFLLGGTEKKPVAGWSQVVFHRDRPVEEIPPINAGSSLIVHTTTVRVREGDVIVYVYTGSRTYHLTGTVSTKDGYNRLYEIELSLCVNNALPLAKAYCQEKDPVWEAINRVQSLFQDYASYYSHDELLSSDAPFEEWNTKWLGKLGIAIRPRSKAMFREDPHYSELARIRQANKELKEKYEQEKAQKEYECEKNTIERDFARREEVKNQVHKICSDLLQAVADEMKETLRERVREGFEKGSLTSEIWDELYTVLYALGDDDRQFNLEQRIVAHKESLEQIRMRPTTDVKRNTATSAQNTESSFDLVTH